jgi:hypothetical protein
MLIVTSGSDNFLYHITIEYNEKKCQEFGYDFRVYDLGGLGFGIPVDDHRCASRFRRIKSAMKPELILDAMNSTDEGLVVWIDGDATLIAPIDELLEDDSFDVGVTVRMKTMNKRTNYINAGVVIIKNNERGKKFVEDWIAAMGTCPPLEDMKTKPADYSDQVILEEKMLLPNIDVVPWDAFLSVHEVHGARVKLFDCDTYNNFWLWKGEFHQPPNGTKILHFKGCKMHRITGYSKEFLE